MENIVNSLESVRDIFITYPERYENAREELSNVDVEIQDVLHAIELGSLDAVGMSRMYKEIQRLRQERRRLKDEIEVLREIQFLGTKKKPTNHQINTAIGQVQSVRSKQDNRTYTMRIRKDLQSFIK